MNSQNVRVTADCPEPGAWSVDEHSLKGRSEWKRSLWRDLYHAHMLRAAEPNGLLKQRDTSWAHVVRYNHARVVHVGSHRGGLAGYRHKSKVARSS